jgi:tripeptide aminopeptidase
MINEQRLVQNFMAMVEIPSVSGREGKMRDFLISIFKERGLLLEEDEAGKIIGGESGNLLLKMPGTIEKEPVLLAAHMDTVQPGEGIKPVSDGTVIRSSGTTILGGDDKAAIAALLEAVDLIQENNLAHPPLEILFTVGEEQGLKGAKAFNFDKLSAKMAYTLDGGGEPGTIIIKSPCQNEIEYRVYGQAAHAGINPEKGVNAIQAAAMAIAKMPAGRIDAETTCNLGIIQGGTARNIVADWCTIKGEARSLKRSKLDQVTELLKNTFTQEVEKYGARAEVKITFLYPEISLSMEEDVVKRAVAAVQRAGLKPVLESTGGGSDASIINGAGIPCVNLGIGMSNVHTCQEYIKISDLHNVVKIVLALVSEGD